MKITTQVSATESDFVQNAHRRHSALIIFFNGFIVSNISFRQPINRSVLQLFRILLCVRPFFDFGKMDHESAFDFSLLDSLQESTKTIVINHVNSLQSKCTATENELEQHKTDLEQKYFEVEKELLTVRDNLRSETSVKVEIAHQLTETESQLRASQQKITDLQEKNASLQSAKDELQSGRWRLQQEKNDFADLVSRKNREVDRLSEELKLAEQNALSASKAKLEAVAAQDDAESRALTLEHRSTRLEHELQQTQLRLQWLQDEYNSASAQLLDVRKDHTNDKLVLESQLAEKSEALQLSEEQVVGQQDRQAELQEQMETYLQRLSASREGQTAMEEHYQLELQVCHIVREATQTVGIGFATSRIYSLAGMS